MLVDTDCLVSMTEANQNFSRVARLVDERGSVVILRQNTPRYVVLDYDAAVGKREKSVGEVASMDEMLAIGARLLKECARVYEELAK